MIRKTESESPNLGQLSLPRAFATIIQLTKEFEFPAKTVFANNFMIIDLRLRF